MQILDHEPLAKNEQPALQELARMLAEGQPVSLVAGKEEIELPKAVVQILRQLVAHMALGQNLFVVPAGPMLTTQEAADILDVSRPYLVTLLEEGKIPFTKVGKHRRVHINDLLTYQKRRDQEQEEALNELTRLSQEFGLYD